MYLRRWGIYLIAGLLGIRCVVGCGGDSSSGPKQQKRDGRIGVLFNDMTAFAELHYGESGLPHQVISRRMQETLGAAVEE